MEINKEAIFAGTFDPITLGHINIIKKALKRFNKITILVAVNENKKPTYSLKDRIKFIKLSTKGIRGIKVDSTIGLTVNYAKKHNIKYLIRGLRNAKDFEYENNMKIINHKLNNDITTIIYKADKSVKDISSSKVKDLKKKGEDLSPYVSSKIIKYL